LTTSPASPPAEPHEQQVSVLSCTISDLEVDEDGFEVEADGSSLSDEDKAEDSRQEAAENEKQSREAASLKARHFWRTQAKMRRAEALRFQRRGSGCRPATSTPKVTPRRTGHRRAPGARPVHQPGSRRTPSRSAGDGSSGDSSDGESEPAGGRRTDLSAQARARLELRAPSAWMQERSERFQRFRRGRPEQLTLEGVASRERYASPEEAEALIAAVPIGDRAIWATATYAGLRLGELRALRVDDVDLAAGVIRVERGWDPAEGVIELKSHAGRRKVPIAAILRDYLAEYLARSGRHGSQLIFGRQPESPFTANRVQVRADDAWAQAGLERLTPHEGRHTFASLMIAAGVNAKALSTFMGHANISITLDRYGHLMPGSEGEAATLLDTYLAAGRDRAEEQARGAELAGGTTMGQ
jgi:integrase